MRKFTPLIVLMLAALACSLPFEIFNPPPIPTTQSPLGASPTPQLVTAIPSLTPLPSETPIPTIPSQPPTQPPAPAVEYDPAVDAYRITFAPNGTWFEVNDHLDVNQSRRYVIAAMQYQTMSVSIRQYWPFTVRVTDGLNELTLPNYEQPSWRGTLPTTQDYFITVTTQISGDFTMRVAVNPPGNPYQYFVHLDDQNHFEVDYSDEFALIIYQPAGDLTAAPVLVLSFINADYYGPTTNLSEAYFIIDIPPDAATCTQLKSPLEQPVGQRTFNGITFTESNSLGVAAGNLYDLEIFRTLQNGTCYEAIFYMHSGNIGNYPEGTVVEFDRARLVHKFEEVLNTFTIR